MSGERPSPAAFWSALGAVYLLWGSTYIAIRFAVESIPPFLSAGVRFVIAGFLLYAVMRARGAGRPTWRHWRSALLIGGLMLAGGNGSVVWAEQTVASSIAALVIATVPLWMAALEPALFGGRAPSRRIWLGLTIGFAGVAWLVWDPANVAVGGAAGLAALVLAAMLWSGGSLGASRVAWPRSRLLGTAMQMVAGGVVLLIMSGVSGEFGRFELQSISTASFVATVYLIIFGSLVAYSCYIWLLSVGPVSTVSTYAYVNPVIAVVLGWALAQERLSLRTALAALAILAAVALIVTRRRPGEATASGSGSSAGG